MKYIDADKLIAEINRKNSVCEEQRADAIEVSCYAIADDASARIGELNVVLETITSLQQEQPVKSQKNCNDCPHCVDRKDQYGWHFKGCFGGTYKGKFIAEIDECPLKQEQPEVDLEKDIDDFFDKWDRNSNGCFFDATGKLVTIKTIKDAVKHFLNAKKEE